MTTFSDQFLRHDLYNVTLPSVFPRSQFYHLEPLGLNTPYTESLTSYITRLAQAHCLTITVFFEQAILEFTREKSKLQERDSAAISSKGTYGINGSDKLATQWIDIIEQITMKNDLQSLSMMRWKYLISDVGLLRNKRAWCPRCYEMWHQNEQPLYDPLIWSIREVVLCTYHKQYLRTRCQHCLRQVSAFSRYGNIGYCPRCYRFLGTSDISSENNDVCIDDNQLQQQVWIVTTIGELIAAAPKTANKQDANIFHSNISLYFHIVTGNNEKKAVIHLELPRTTTRKLLSHRNIPKITTLLKISQKLKVTLLSLLTVNLQREHLEGLEIPETNIPKQSKKKKRAVSIEQLSSTLEKQLETNEPSPPSLREVAKRLGCSINDLTEFYPEISRKIEAKYRKYHNIKLIDVQSALEAALISKEDPPPRVTHIARQFGFSTAHITNRFPELTHLISERYRSSWTRRLGVMKQHLENAIASTSNKYTSIKQIAQDVGCSAGSLHKHFPDLCRTLAAKSHSPIDIDHLRHMLTSYLEPIDTQPLPFMEVAKQLNIGEGTISRYCPHEAKAISTQYETYQRTRGQQRKQRLADEARQVTFELYSNGIYPSAGKVGKRLSNQNNMRVPEVFAAWKQALAELSLLSSNVQNDLTESS